MVMMLPAVTGHRIVTAGMPGVAAAETFAGKPATAQDAMGFNGFACVLRASGRVATMVAEKRAQQIAVRLNQNDQDFSHCLMMPFQCCSRAFRISAGSAARISRLTIITISRAGKRC